MLTLYYKPTCPFSKQVLGVAEELGLKMTLKDISADEQIKEELIARGGRKQTPYLVDDEHNIEMYESNDIVNHLLSEHGETDGAGSFNGLRIHKSEEACDTCQ